jgi:hypothetical protein
MASSKPADSADARQTRQRIANRWVMNQSGTDFEHSSFATVMKSGSACRGCGNLGTYVMSKDKWLVVSFTNVEYELDPKGEKTGVTKRP